jgi:DNA-binding transcriptional regulator of glucitol operon
MGCSVDSGLIVLMACATITFAAILGWQWRNREEAEMVVCCNGQATNACNTCPFNEGRKTGEEASSDAA